MQDGKYVECTKKEHCSAGYKCEYNKCKEEEKCKAPTPYYKVSYTYYLIYCSTSMVVVA